MQDNIKKFIKKAISNLIENTSKEVNILYNWIGIEYSENILDVSKNTKYKGKYGDPFQNSEEKYSDIKNKVVQNKISKPFTDFIKGYANFLGKDFLLKYGNYIQEESSLKKTKSFSYFMHINTRKTDNYNFKKELKYFLKEVYFSVFNELK